MSRAYVDYSTSGSENPLTHLLLALFALEVLEDGPWSESPGFRARVPFPRELLTLNLMDRACNFRGAPRFA
jgi:hypothetical protein